MAFRFFHAGLTALLVIVVCSAGCGMSPLRQGRTVDDLPPSNTRILERAVLEALENMGLPEGAGERVRLEFKGDQDTANVLKVIVPGFLKGLGYDVYIRDAGQTGLVVRAESMAVTLTVEHRLLSHDRVLRRADAGLSLERHEQVGSKRVYQGSSVILDEFDVGYLPVAGNDKALVSVHDSGGVLSEKLGKPLVLGVTMTALAWLLYAYRG